MDLAITWICLGGGITMIIIGLVTISRLQGRTRDSEDDTSDAGR